MAMPPGSGPNPANPAGPAIASTRGLPPTPSSAPAPLCRTAPAAARIEARNHRVEKLLGCIGALAMDGCVADAVVAPGLQPFGGVGRPIARQVGGHNVDEARSTKIGCIILDASDGEAMHDGAHVLQVARRERCPLAEVFD